MLQNPAAKYRPFPAVDLADRQEEPWVTKRRCDKKTG